MRIRTQQILGAILAAAAIGAIAVTLLDSMKQTDQAVLRSNFATSINADGISGLRLVTVEYLIYRNERARLQWQQRHKSLARLLVQNVFTAPDERVVFDRIRQQHLDLDETFSDLLELDLDRGNSERELAMSSATEKRLVTNVMLLSQTMVLDATLLTRMTAQRIVATQLRTNWLLVGLVTLLGLIIAANFWASMRQIVLPIKKLRIGAEGFARGELGVRTGLTVNNELGDLSQTFDQMAARLADTMAEVERKSTQLQETNKELEAFSYSVSHDLRSPLRGIDGWGLALLEDYGDQLDATAHEYLERIRFDTQRMGRLIDDLLQLARVTRGEIRFEAVDLSALARSVAERLQQAPAERQIEFLIEPGLTSQGDPRLLEIVLTNLLGNACKFTGTRAAAHIEFGSTLTEEPGARVQSQVYFVRDNGVGFEMAHATRLFGAFQRMHKESEFPGTGIGLATVQRIVHRHGGKVWAKASLDLGASFYFTLPQSKPSPGTPLRDDKTKESS
jgi:signal transduction histidine kinase